MNGALILAYHRVLPDELVQHRGVLPVTVRQFSREMEYFARRHWKSCTLFELYRDYLLKAVAPRKVVVVTFDDGYRDNFRHAFPVLRGLGMKATVFLTAGYMGTERNLSAELYPHTRTGAFVPFEEDAPLTRGQVREMMSMGMEFGSHTISHCHLTQVEEHVAQDEIIGSKKILEDFLDTTVHTFCYPYGDLNEGIVGMVRDAGYEAAVVTPPRRGIAETALTLRRRGIYRPDTMIRFRAKCSGMFDRARETAAWDLLRRRGVGR